MVGQIFPVPSCSFSAPRDPIFTLADLAYLERSFCASSISTPSSIAFKVSRLQLFICFPKERYGKGHTGIMPSRSLYIHQWRPPQKLLGTDSGAGPWEQKWPRPHPSVDSELPGSGGWVGNSIPLWLLLRVILGKQVKNTPLMTRNLGSPSAHTGKCEG